MSAFNFEELSDEVKNPLKNFITKVEIVDGAELTLYEGSFAPLHISPAPSNNNALTLWYTASLSQKGNPMTVQLRWFLEGQATTPNLHHYVGSCLVNGEVWFLFLDRTRAARAANEEMREALRTASHDINRFVTEILDTADTDRDMSKEDFIRKLFESIENEEGE